MKRQHSVQVAAKLGALLCCTALLITSCGVTSPDETVWGDVSKFSWPTQVGTLMKYRNVSDTGSFTQEIVIDTNLSSNSSDLLGTYVLNNGPDALFGKVSYQPSKDTLYVYGEVGLSAEIALLAPLVKGHEWYSYNSSDQDNNIWHAEIIERYAFRKVQGTTYENVIAVKYRKYENGLNAPPETSEWIRFYAEGVGEIMTVENTYPNSNAPSEVLPQQASKRELIEITPAAN
ncbi:MAG: hypothetical protein KDD67_12785 [Ignavibacteriae bacterium]|nr:hypothetical protein [Ignavibacteriota bacterium]MCB9214351.1 hypothetical protein [Ignavibacteria bacterium]